MGPPVALHPAAALDSAGYVTESRDNGDGGGPPQARREAGNADGYEVECEDAGEAPYSTYAGTSMVEPSYVDLQGGNATYTGAGTKAPYVDPQGGNAPHAPPTVQEQNDGFDGIEL